MAIHTNDSFRFAATGDAIITRRLSPYDGETEDFTDLLSVLREADATVTNFEMLIADESAAPSGASGGTYMRAPSYVIDELGAMGCDVFSAATNHAFDYGPSGIKRTVAAFNNREQPVAGLGMNEFEARQPAYIETAAGRVGVVSVSTSVTPGSRASNPTPATPGRPGVSALGVETIYRLPEQYVDQFQTISEAVGFEDQKQSWMDRGLYYNHDWNQSEFFHFGDLKFKPTTGDGGVEYRIDHSDLNTVTEWVKETAATADWVISTVHSHQGVDGKQNTTSTPQFLQNVAHNAVDAGADVVIGTGPHVLRGIEIYDDVPIFYSLGNFILQDETIDRLPPENYRRYGLDEYSHPSKAFDARNHDADGNRMSDRANPDCWITVVPECRFGTENCRDITLHPVTLQQDCPRPQCGVPVLATGTQAVTILEEVRERSEPFGTTIEIVDGVGHIRLDDNSSEHELKDQ